MACCPRARHRCFAERDRAGERDEASMTVRHAAFVIPHPYVDALACFREPIKRLAKEGWEVDLYTTLSPVHPPPAFNRQNVRLRPIEMTRSGALRLVAQLVSRRPKYDWLFTVPQWSMHYGGIASSLAKIPMVCISDELKTEAEATSGALSRWKRREQRAHERCAFTVALSEERGAFIREENPDRAGGLGRWRQPHRLVPPRRHCRGSLPDLFAGVLSSMHGAER